MLPLSSLSVDHVLLWTSITLTCNVTVYLTIASPAVPLPTALSVQGIHVLPHHSQRYCIEVSALLLDGHGLQTRMSVMRMRVMRRSPLSLLLRLPRDVRPLNMVHK